MDTALLIVRLVVGLLFIGHGTQKLFGWFSGHGPRGTGQWFESLGFSNGAALAVVAGMGEAGGGLLVASGWLTWLGGAAIIGVMLNAIVVVHRRNGPWISNGGYEYALVMLTIGLALGFAGPGRLSLDSALGMVVAGWEGGVAAAALGVLAATSILLTRRARPGAERGRRAA